MVILLIYISNEMEHCDSVVETYISLGDYRLHQAAIPARAVRLA
jgi:hypothetical protein